MANVANVRVFEAELGAVIERAFSALNRAQGFSGRAQIRMAQKMREVLRVALERTIDDGFPVRTGRTKAQAQAGIRVFGTSFNNIRGHIIAPAYIRLMDEGGEIEPRQAEFLAIPFGYALRPDGTPKLPGPRSWKNVVNTFVYKSKRTGGLYIAFKTADGKLQVLYTLVEMAEFKPRRFLQKAWNKQKGDLFAEFGNIMVEEIARVDVLRLARITYKGRKV